MDGRNILKTLTNMKLEQTGGTLLVGGFSMIPLLVAGDTIKLQKPDWSYTELLRSTKQAMIFNISQKVITPSPPSK